MDNDRLVVKLVPHTLSFNREFKKNYPKVRQIFIARHPKQCLNSWNKMALGEKIGMLWK